MLLLLLSESSNNILFFVFANSDLLSTISLFSSSITDVVGRYCSFSSFLFCLIVIPKANKYDCVALSSLSFIYFKLFLKDTKLFSIYLFSFVLIIFSVVILWPLLFLSQISSFKPLSLLLLFLSSSILEVTLL